jgi:hypothetical protein
VTLDELAELERKATPGPWFGYLTTVVGAGATIQVQSGWLFQQKSGCVMRDGRGTMEDAVLTCALRNLAPELIAVARAAANYRRAIKGEAGLSTIALDGKSLDAALLALAEKEKA